MPYPDFNKIDDQRSTLHKTLIEIENLKSHVFGFDKYLERERNASRAFAMDVLYKLDSLTQIADLYSVLISLNDKITSWDGTLEIPEKFSNELEKCFVKLDDIKDHDLETFLDKKHAMEDIIQIVVTNLKFKQYELQEAKYAQEVSEFDGNESRYEDILGNLHGLLRDVESVIENEAFFEDKQKLMECVQAEIYNLDGIKNCLQYLNEMSEKQEEISSQLEESPQNEEEFLDLYKRLESISECIESVPTFANSFAEENKQEILTVTRAELDKCNVIFEKIERLYEIFDNCKELGQVMDTYAGDEKSFQYVKSTLVTNVDVVNLIPFAQVTCVKNKKFKVINYIQDEIERIDDIYAEHTLGLIQKELTSLTQRLEHFSGDSGTFFAIRDAIDVHVDKINSLSITNKKMLETRCDMLRALKRVTDDLDTIKNSFAVANRILKVSQQLFKEILHNTDEESFFILRKSLGELVDALDAIPTLHKDNLEKKKLAVKERIQHALEVTSSTEEKLIHLEKIRGTCENFAREISSGELDFGSFLATKRQLQSSVNDLNFILSQGDVLIENKKKSVLSYINVQMHDLDVVEVNFVIDNVRGDFKTILCNISIFSGDEENFIVILEELGNLQKVLGDLKTELNDDVHNAKSSVLVDIITQTENIKCIYQSFQELESLRESADVVSHEVSKFDHDENTFLNLRFELSKTVQYIEDVPTYTHKVLQERKSRILSKTTADFEILNQVYQRLIQMETISSNVGKFADTLWKIDAKDVMIVMDEVLANLHEVNQIETDSKHILEVKKNVITEKIKEFLEQLQETWIKFEIENVRNDIKDLNNATNIFTNEITVTHAEKKIEENIVKVNSFLTDNVSLKTELNDLLDVLKLKLQELRNHTIAQ